MSDSIELVIKAANGSVDDFKMTAQHNWTVTQVKNHIYRHYPTHPVSRNSLKMDWSRNTQNG